MVIAINKIKEMQKKLNIINTNIDEIKNERKTFEEKKEINDELLISANNKVKSFYNQENSKNSSTFNNFKINRTYNRNKNTINFENNSKYYNAKYPINNKIGDNKIDEKICNYIDNYSNKRHDIIKNRSCSSTMKVCDKDNIFKKKNINKIKKYFYQKSLKENKNNYYFFTKNNIKKHSCSNINLLTTIKKNIKLKNYFNERNNKKNINNYDNYEKINKKDHKYKIFDNKDSIMDLTNKNLLNDKLNILYENNLYNNSNEYDNNNNIMYEKIKIRNNSFRSPNHMNSNNKEFINTFHKNKSYNIFENSNIKTQRNMSFNNMNLKNNFNINNLYNNEKECKKRIYNPMTDMKKNIIKKNDIKNINYQQMVLDIIDITNEYNIRSNEVNVNNIIDEYKLLLHNLRVKDKFIFKLVNKYNDLNNIDLNYNDPKSLVEIWNYINQNNFNNINKEENEYVQLCHELMEKFNLNDIHQLRTFIDKSLKKNDNNDNFLEGIKKILSS